MLPNYGATYFESQNHPKKFHVNLKKSTENPQLKIIRKAVFFGGEKRELLCQTYSNSALRLHSDEQS